MASVISTRPSTWTPWQPDGHGTAGLWLHGGRRAAIFATATVTADLTGRVEQRPHDAIVIVLAGPCERPFRRDRSDPVHPPPVADLGCSGRAVAQRRQRQLHRQRPEPGRSRQRTRERWAIWTATAIWMPSSPTGF